jgi:sugar lactone lactonase YvrE
VKKSARALVLIALAIGCSPTVETFAPQATKKPRIPPVTPIISVSASIVAGTTSVPASITNFDAGLLYEWRVLNGALTTGTTGQAVAFTAGTAGQILYTVTVSNAYGDTAPPANAVSTIVQGLPADYVPQLFGPLHIIEGRTGNRVVLQNPFAGAINTWSISSGQIDSSDATQAYISSETIGILTVTVSSQVPGAYGGDANNGTWLVEVDPTPSASMSLVAGELGGPGYLDGPANNARFPLPGKLDVNIIADTDGTLWIGDDNTCTLRVMHDGIVSTLGFPNDCRIVDGDTTTARVAAPQQMALDGQGGIWFIDNIYDDSGSGAPGPYGYPLRHATIDGITSHGAPFTAVSYTNANCASVDGDGDPLPLDQAVFCAGPQNLVTTSNGDIYVTTTSTFGFPAIAGALRRYPANNGTPEWLFTQTFSSTCDVSVGATTLAGMPTQTSGFNWLMGDGSSVYWEGGSNVLVRYDPVARAMQSWPEGVGTCNCGFNQFSQGTAAAITPAGNVFSLASFGNVLVAYTVAAQDAFTTCGQQIASVILAGGTTSGYADGPVGTSEINANVQLHSFHPHFLTTQPDAAGGEPSAIFLYDSLNAAIRKIAPLDATTAYASAVTSTIAGGPAHPGLQNGDAAQSLFRAPLALALDFDGTIYVGDNGNGDMRRIGTDGTVSTLFGTDKPGVRDGPATSAGLKNVTAMVVMPNRDIVFADGGLIRRYGLASGETLTVLGDNLQPTGFADGSGAIARMLGPIALALGSNGSIIMSDAGNNAIRMMLPDDELVTLVGPTQGDTNNGFASTFNAPLGVTVASDGTIFVSDTGNHQIRSLTLAPAGNLTVSLVAGDPAAAMCVVQDGPCAHATFRQPTAMTARPNGDILVIDAWDKICGSTQTDRSTVIRLVEHPEDPATCTVSTVVGGTDPRFQAAAAPAPLPASLNTPSDLVLGPNQDFWIADPTENSILEFDLGE